MELCGQTKYVVCPVLGAVLVPGYETDKEGEVISFNGPRDKPSRSGDMKKSSA